MFFNLSPVPNLPPANIRAIGASSLSINITWDGVPKDGRNGVVLGYKVRVLKFNVAHYDLSGFYIYIYTGSLPLRGFSVADYLTHPVNFPCGRKREKLEKTHDFR